MAARARDQHLDQVARGGPVQARRDEPFDVGGRDRTEHERLGLPGGVRFRLVKRIPARAGMGGGSADAAAAMAAVMALHGVRLPRSRRLALAAEIGSDVPFALVGGTALGRGRGERLTSLHLAKPFRAVIAMPSWTVSTTTAFARL